MENLNRFGPTIEFKLSCSQLKPIFDEDETKTKFELTNSRDVTKEPIFFVAKNQLGAKKPSQAKSGGTKNRVM